MLSSPPCSGTRTVQFDHVARTRDRRGYVAFRIKAWSAQEDVVLSGRPETYDLFSRFGNLFGINVG